MKNKYELTLLIIPIIVGGITYLGMGMPSLYSLRVLLTLSIAVLGSVWVYGIALFCVVPRYRKREYDMEGNPW